MKMTYIYAHFEDIHFEEPTQVVHLHCTVSADGVISGTLSRRATLTRYFGRRGLWHSGRMRPSSGGKNFGLGVDSNTLLHIPEREMLEVRLEEAVQRLGAEVWGLTHCIVDIDHTKKTMRVCFTDRNPCTRRTLYVEPSKHIKIYLVTPLFMVLHRHQTIFDWPFDKRLGTPTIMPHLEDLYGLGGTDADCSE